MKATKRILCIALAAVMMLAGVMFNTTDVKADEDTYLLNSTIYCTPTNNLPDGYAREAIGLTLRNKSQYKAHWSTTNKNVVAGLNGYDTGCDFVGGKAGTAKIKCKVDGKTYTCTVKVSNQYKPETLAKKVKVKNVEKLGDDLLTAQVTNNNKVAVEYYFHVNGYDKYNDKTDFTTDCQVLVPAGETITAYIDASELSQYTTVTTFKIQKAKNAEATDTAKYLNKVSFDVDTAAKYDEEDAIGRVSSTAKVCLNLSYDIIAFDSDGNYAGKTNGYACTYIKEKGKEFTVYNKTAVTKEGYTYKIVINKIEVC